MAPSALGTDAGDTPDIGPELPWDEQACSRSQKSTVATTAGESKVLEMKQRQGKAPSTPSEPRAGVRKDLLRRNGEGLFSQITNAHCCY